MKTIYDTIVIGLGAAGSSSLYYLGKSGRRVLGVDRFKWPHKNGSSHGDTRIIRQAYFEGEGYVPFAKRAYKLWNQIEKIENTQLYLKLGALNIGKRNDNIHLVEKCKLAADKYNLNYSILSNRQINDYYPFFDIKDDDYYALREDNAGLLYPEKCVESYLKLSKENKNSEILFDTTIDKIEYDSVNKLYNVNINDKIVKTDSIVLSCGSWLNNILTSNFKIKLPLTVDLNFLYYFKFKNQNLNYDLFPVYIISIDEDTEFYGFPDLKNNNGFKFGLYHQNMSHQTVEEVKRDYREDNYKRCFNIANQFIKGFEENFIDIIKHLTCLYTTTPDRDFLIDYLPNTNDKIVIASACSGHGFKFSSAVGEHVTNLINKTEKSYEMFSIKRLSDKINYY